MALNAITTAATRTNINIRSAPLRVIAGDFFEVVATQSSGGDLAIEIGSSLTWFAIERLK